MAQYTFSYLRSEYDRIPIQLRRDLKATVENADVDEAVKKALTDICSAVDRAVSDLSKYAQDQLRIW